MSEICDATYRGYTCGLLKGHAGNHRPQMEHKCHWPGCDLAVPPAMWGCKPHWFSIPKKLRDEIREWLAATPSETKGDAGG